MRHCSMQPPLVQIGRGSMSKRQTTPSKDVRDRLVAEAVEALRVLPALRWWDRSACKGMDTNAFVDEDISAKSVCVTCPVRVDCLGEALRVPDIVGIWGGTTSRERVRLRDAVTPRATVVFDETVTDSQPGSVDGNVTVEEPASVGDPPADGPGVGEPVPVEVPEWVTFTNTASRWQVAGSGPGPAGQWHIDGVDIVVRDVGDGTFVAYVRCASQGSAA